MIFRPKQHLKTVSRKNNFFIKRRGWNCQLNFLATFVWNNPAKAKYEARLYSFKYVKQREKTPQKVTTSLRVWFVFADLQKLMQ